MSRFLKKQYVKPVILIVIGCVFLMDSLFGFDSDIAFRFFYKFWPLFLIIPGVMLLFNQADPADNGEHLETDKKEVKKSE